MWIQTKDKKATYNSYHMMGLQQEENQITALLSDGTKVVLGEYDTPEEVEQQYNRLLNTYPLRNQLNTLNNLDVNIPNTIAVEEENDEFSNDAISYDTSYDVTDSTKRDEVYDFVDNMKF